MTCTPSNSELTQQIERRKRLAALAGTRQFAANEMFAAVVGLMIELEMCSTADVSEMLDRLVARMNAASDGAVETDFEICPAELRAQAGWLAQKAAQCRASE